ncbi:unnamed protein product [Symbiodinium sp. CCMP2592]|nr:unnamed protein product [Symbiodinium sp. CCMP2592]
MSRRAPSPPPLTASPLTVPDSPSPRSPLGDRTPLAPVMAAPATAEPMPMRLAVAPDSPPPSPPSSPREGDVTPEFALPPLAACPVCLQAPSSQPQAEDAVFPCCAAFTHLSCVVQCARRHGSCPNCRAAVDHLPREPSIASRCRQLGIDLEPETPPPHDTAFAVVRGYSTRTFSRADAPEPVEPLHIRAVCCRRLAGPAMDFVELPDARMHWAPVPQRRTDGIGAWQALWICMRCQNELPLDRVTVPEPRPACPLCEVPLHWEVDMSRRQERWVCGRCPFAQSPRPLALELATRPPVDEGAPAGATEHPTSHTHNGPAPWPPLHRPEAHASIVNLGPPPLPFRDGTNSRVYVPLLLDAAGLLPADAQWRTHAPIGEWWPAAVAALLARPFIPVRELCTAVEHVSHAFPPQALVSSTLERFCSWAPPRVAQVASLAEVLCAITSADEGHYIGAPLQEALIALLVGAAAASTLERIVDRLRASEPGAALLPAPPAPDSAAPLEAPTHESSPPEAPDASAPASPAAYRYRSSGGAAPRLHRAACRSRSSRPTWRTRARARPEHLLTSCRLPSRSSLSAAPALTTAAQRRVSAAESGLLTGLASLIDGVDLQDTLQQRVLTLQGELRGWKLFCLAPRMLLQRSGGESLIPPAELDRRYDLFARGVWPELLQLASGSAAPRSRAGMPPDDLAARAARATALVHIGELSAAGRALVAEPLAPGTDATLAELRDPSRRPPTPYAPLPQDIATYQADDPGPPTSICASCDDEGDTQLLHRAACRLARADLPPPVLAALRVGRLTALQKPNGRGVRALVIGDVLRRLGVASIVDRLRASEPGAALLPAPPAPDSAAPLEAPSSLPQPQLAADVADAGEGEAGAPPHLLPPPLPLQPQRRETTALPLHPKGSLRASAEPCVRLSALACSYESPAQELRGWKLFCLAPRMLLQRSGGESLIPPAELDRRYDLFARGVWPELLQLASGSAAPRSRTGMPPDDLAARAARATALVHIGELSAAGRALVAEPLAPGTDATLAELRDPSRRPPTPYAPLPQDIATYQADDPCPFPLPAFVACLRSARRGAAAGPSGATNEHLRILLDDEGDTQLLHRAACRLARADLPPPVLAALRVGRLTALQKPVGRVLADPAALYAFARLAVHTGTQLLHPAALLEFRARLRELVEAGQSYEAAFTHRLLGVDCVRCREGRGGFRFPFVGTYARRSIVVSGAVAPAQAWAEYHRSGPERLSFDDVFRMGSGLWPTDILPDHANRLVQRIGEEAHPRGATPGQLWLLWRDWHQGERIWREPAYSPIPSWAEGRRDRRSRAHRALWQGCPFSRLLARVVACRLFSSVTVAESQHALLAPIPASAAHRLRVFLAASLAGPMSGIYAVQAMEGRAGAVDAPPGTAAETVVDRMAARAVNSFRERHGLQADNDFAYAFSSWEEASHNAGHAVADAWSEVSQDMQDDALLGLVDRAVAAGAAAAEAGHSDWPCEVSELADFMVEAGARRPADVTGARRQEWLSFLRVLAAKKVAASERSTVAGTLRTLRELSQWQHLRGRSAGLGDVDAIDLFAFLQEGTQASSKALVGLRWFTKMAGLPWDLEGLRPTALSQLVLPSCGVCFDRAGRPWELRQVTLLTQEIFTGLDPPVTTYSWRRVGPSVGSLLQLDELSLLALGDWADRGKIRETGASMPLHYSGTKYSMSVKTKHLVWAAVSRCLTFDTWSEVPPNKLKQEEASLQDEVAEMIRLDATVIWRAPPGTPGPEAKLAFKTTALKLRRQSRAAGAGETRPGPSEPGMPPLVNGRVCSAFLRNGPWQCNWYLGVGLRSDLKHHPGRQLRGPTAALPVQLRQKGHQVLAMSAEPRGRKRQREGAEERYDRLAREPGRPVNRDALQVPTEIWESQGGSPDYSYGQIPGGPRRETDFQSLLPLVRATLLEGQNVVTHCMAGRHRGAAAGTVLRAVLSGESLDDCEAFIQARRDIELNRIRRENRDLAEWMLRAARTTRLGPPPPLPVAFVATNTSLMHLENAAGITLCQHRQSKGARKLVRPMRTTDRFEAYAWAKACCTQCFGISTRGHSEKRYIQAFLGETQSAGSRGLSDRRVGIMSQALVPRDGNDFKAALDTLSLNFSLAPEIQARLLSDGLSHLEELRFFFDNEEHVGRWVAKLSLGDKTMLETSRLRRAWAAVRLYFSTSEQDRSKVALTDLDTLLEDSELRDVKLAFWKRYRMRFPAEVHPADSLLSRVSREINKRMLCVYAIWKVRSLYFQLTTVQRKRKLGDNLYTEEPDTEEAVTKDADTYLDKLYTLLLAYSMAGVFPLPGVDMSKEAVLSASSADFVGVPLDVAMAYFFRAKRCASQLPPARRLQWLLTKDVEGRSEWVTRFREGNSSLGLIIKQVMEARDAHWVVTGAALSAGSGETQVTAGTAIPPPPVPQISHFREGPKVGGKRVAAVLKDGCPEEGEGDLPSGNTMDPPVISSDRPPLMMDLMCGPNAPLTRAFLFCGWRAGPVDLLLNPAQDISRSEFQAELRPSLDQACLLFAALDCSTKSAIREIPLRLPSGRSGPPPLRSHEHPMGLPGLKIDDQRRVSKDNCACRFVLDEQQRILERGGEAEMWASDQWWDTRYDACCFMGARRKRQRLRHNVWELTQGPSLLCHHTHHPQEWQPWEAQGRVFYPSKEEAEYTAPLAFHIAVACSWWAGRLGLAQLRVPRGPPIQCVGRREHWLEIDSRALREWAMSPLAISLGLRPIDPGEAARVPVRVEVASVLREHKSLPPDVIYVGRGHHSHRLPVTQWASPFVPGHNCGADEWLPLYVEHVLSNLQTDLVQLEGRTLACDCALSQVCEGDLLAGLVFDAGRPQGIPHQGAAGRPRRSAQKRSRRVLLAAAASALPTPVGAVIPYLHQDSVVATFQSFFPGVEWGDFRFPMVEDLINAPPFTDYVQWCRGRQEEWDGPLLPQLVSAQQRQWQRTAEGQQVGAMAHRAALPPALPFALQPDVHFDLALELARYPTPFEQPPALDLDLCYAAEVTACKRGGLREWRQASLGAIRELKRRWAGVDSRLRASQQAPLRRVTRKRDIGLLALLCLLVSWGDPTLPHDFLFGMAAVGTAPVYGVFPLQSARDVSHAEVLADASASNARVRASLRPGRDDAFLLEQSLRDAESGFCSEPLRYPQLLRAVGGLPFRLIPRCVITQSSGKQRIIDNADTGGQSELSSDPNKLVLCSPLRPAQHAAALLACLDEPSRQRAAAEDALEGGGEDWPEAYRHCPMDGASSRCCVVVWWHQEWGEPAYQLYRFAVWPPFGSYELQPL